jgi:DNA-binding NarL/FixJ family response regulator
MNEDTRKEVGKCPECGSIDRGTRHLITPPTADNPLGTFCKNAWHDVPPEVHGDEFTEQEFQFIFGVCSGLSHREIAQRYKTAEDVIKSTLCGGIYDKLNVSTRMELNLVVRAALNGELRRRNSQK